ncbi:MAG: hypothetical protein ACLSH6_06175 [Limosilactobacillus pontis]
MVHQWSRRIGPWSNPLIAFATWQVYNFEDAIAINERLVKDDVYTSIHRSYRSKRGKPSGRRDDPGNSNVGDDALKDLDENGIVRVGAAVRRRHLVGKLRQE